MSLTFVMFIVLAILAIGGAVFTITSKNPIASAIGLVFHFFMLAGIYLTLKAQFLAVLQVLVYAGAIMVLVVFVIMLLNLRKNEALQEKFSPRKILALLFGAVFAVQMFMIFLLGPGGKAELPESARITGSPGVIGRDLFSAYIVPFEAIGLLLVVAILGAVVLAKRNVE